MTYEFTGKTEEEAIQNAVNELGLERDAFDVEIIEKKGFLKRGPVKIKVYVDDGIEEEKEESAGETYEITDLEMETVDFLKNIIEKMDISAINWPQRFNTGCTSIVGECLCFQEKRRFKSCC